MGSLPHSLKLATIAIKCSDLPGQLLAVELAIQNHFRCSSVLQRLGVPPLVVISRKGIGDQDRRFAEGCKFGDRGGSGATDDKIRMRVSLIHLSDKGKNRRLEREKTVSCVDRGKILLSGLMDDAQP